MRSQMKNLRNSGGTREASSLEKDRGRESLASTQPPLDTNSVAKDSRPPDASAQVRLATPFVQGSRTHVASSPASASALLSRGSGGVALARKTSSKSHDTQTLSRVFLPVLCHAGASHWQKASATSFRQPASFAPLSSQCHTCRGGPGSGVFGVTDMPLLQSQSPKTPDP
jgi:cytochrome c1